MGYWSREKRRLRALGRARKTSDRGLERMRKLLAWFQHRSLQAVAVGDVERAKAIHAKTERAIQDAKKQLDRAEGLNRQLAEALKAAEEKIVSYEEIAIPTQVAINDTFRQMATAEASQMVMRQTLLEQKRAET